MHELEARTTAPYIAQVRLLVGAAMVIFVFTVVVGILNGIDVIDFDRKTILTHERWGG